MSTDRMIKAILGYTSDSIISDLESSHIVDITLNDDLKEVTFTDGCDRYFSADYNKQMVGKLIDELKEMHSKMVDDNENLQSKR